MQRSVDHIARFCKLVCLYMNVKKLPLCLAGTETWNAGPRLADTVCWDLWSSETKVKVENDLESVSASQVWQRCRRFLKTGSWLQASSWGGLLLIVLTRKRQETLKNLVTSKCEAELW